MSGRRKRSSILSALTPSKRRSTPRRIATLRARPGDYGTVDYLVAVRCEGAPCELGSLFAEQREVSCIATVDDGLGINSVR